MINSENTNGEIAAAHKKWQSMNGSERSYGL
jgi:hypothetical protein